jgi:hypothetical protein
MMHGTVIRKRGVGETGDRYESERDDAECNYVHPE